jgi:PAS domain S-box-containing protein
MLDNKASDLDCKELFNNANIGIAVYKTDDNGKTFKFVDFNPTAEEITQRKKADIIDKNLVDIFPGSIEMGVFDAIKKAWETGQKQRISPKKYMDERINSYYDNVIYRNQHNEVVAIFQDTTVQEKALENLRSTESKYKNLIMSMTEGVAVHEIILDDKGKPINYKIIEINDAFEIITGLRRDHIVGKKILDILPGLEAYWIEAYGEVAISGKPKHFEQYSQDLGKYYSVTAFSPEPKKFAVIFTDITQRKKEEEDLKKRLLETERINKIMIGRELRMAELKRELEELKRKCGEK